MTFTIFTTFLIFLTLLTLNYNYGFASKMTIHHSKHPTLKHFNKVNEESHGKGALSVIKSVYVTSMEIGHQKLFLVFDTGSHFTWVQWEKCRVCLPNEPAPIIAPYHKTDEFMYEFCIGAQGSGNNCKYTPRSVCQSNTLCMYQMKYLDQSGSIGYVGTDIIAPFNDRNISHRMVFGIGLENRCYPLNYSCFQGVAGFGVGSLTIPSQLIPKPTRWAFCLPYNESKDGSLMVGDEAQIYGDYKTAPLINAAHYYLTILSAISVIGRGLVPIDSPSNIIIDTGTTLTYLENSAFDSLVSMIKDLVDEKFDDFPIIVPYLSDLDLELCYEKPYQIEIVIVLGDAYIHIDDPQKVWLKFSKNAYCLSFKRNVEAPHSILGSYHIRGYKVVYDLNPENPTIQVSTGQDETGCFTPVTA